MNKKAKKTTRKATTKTSTAKSSTQKTSLRGSSQKLAGTLKSTTQKGVDRPPAVSVPLELRTENEIRVASWNVNGIRSVFGKGLTNWIADSDLDVIMLQEVKAGPQVLSTDLQNFHESHGYGSIHWAVAEKPGYSGLLTLCRSKPDRVQVGLLDPKFDSEGRWLEVDLGPYTFINSYFPNSQRERARLPYKLEFCSAAQARLCALESQGRTVVLAGDINVAHTEIDLANPKSNQKNAGFLPEERAWFSRFLDLGFVDVFREFETGPGHYTWWSYRPGVREKNIGWRLDHFFISAKAKTRARWMIHQPHVYGSDHCPIVMSLKA